MPKREEYEASLRSARACAAMAASSDLPDERRFWCELYRGFRERARALSPRLVAPARLVWED